MSPVHVSEQAPGMNHSRHRHDNHDGKVVAVVDQGMRIGIGTKKKKDDDDNDDDDDDDNSHT